MHLLGIFKSIVSPSASSTQLVSALGQASKSNDVIAQFISKRAKATFTDSDIAKANKLLRLGKFEELVQTLCPGTTISKLGKAVNLTPEQILLQMRQPTRAMPNVNTSILKAKYAEFSSLIDPTELHDVTRLLKSKNIDNVDLLLNKKFLDALVKHYKPRQRTSLLTGSSTKVITAGGVVLVTGFSAQQIHAAVKSLMRQNSGCFLTSDVGIQGSTKSTCKLKNNSCKFPVDGIMCADVMETWPNQCLENETINTTDVCKNCFCRDSESLSGYPCTESTRVYCSEPSYSDCLAEVVDQVCDGVVKGIQAVGSTFGMIWRYVPYVFGLVLAALCAYCFSLGVRLFYSWNSKELAILEKQ